MGARRPVRARADRAAGSGRRASTRRPSKGTRAGSRLRRGRDGSAGLQKGAGLGDRVEALNRPRGRRGVVRGGVGYLRPLVGVPGRNPLRYGSGGVCRRLEAIARYRIGATETRGRGREAGSVALVRGKPTPRRRHRGCVRGGGETTPFPSRSRGAQRVARGGRFGVVEGVCHRGQTRGHARVRRVFIA